MKRALFSFILIFVLHFLGHSQDLAANAFEKSVPAGTIENDSKQAPFLFEENLGQVRDLDNNVRPDVLFKAETKGMQVYLLDNALSFVFVKSYYSEELDVKVMEMDASGDKIYKHYHDLYRMDLEFLGANPKPQVLTEGESKFYRNYYKGTSENWIENARSYHTVTYHDIYSNIDLILYANENGIKYDFVVHPNGDVDDIQMKFNGGECEVLRDGSIEIKSPLGNLNDAAPFSYQNEKEVETTYSLQKNVISFEVEDYNSLKDLVIDPMISWVTYLGGNGQDLASSIDVGSSKVYCYGETESFDMPTTPGIINDEYGGDSDAYLSCFNEYGEFLWATYIASEQNEFATDCKIKYYNENIYICGATYGFDFPISDSAYQSSLSSEGYSDAFLMRLDNNGSIQWSTYFGGNSYDSFYDFTIHENTIIAIGSTHSTNLNLSENGIQSNLLSQTGGLVTKFEINGDYLFGTLISHEDGIGIQGIDCNNDYIVISGITHGDYGVSENAIQTDLFDDHEPIIFVFNSELQVHHSTYVGGIGTEFSHSKGIKITDENQIYFSIYSSNPINSDFISQNPLQSLAQSHFNTDYQTAVISINADGQKLWGTYLSTPDGTTRAKLELGIENSVWLSMRSTIPEFSIGPSFINHSGNQNDIDGRIVNLNSNGELLFQTYFGSTEVDYFSDCAIYENKIYGLGRSHSPLLPYINDQSYQSENLGLMDWFISCIELYPLFHSHNSTLCNSDTIELSLYQYAAFDLNNTFSFEVSTDSSFNEILFQFEFESPNDTLLNIDLAETLPSGQYYSRILSTNPSNEGDYHIFSFTIETEPLVQLPTIPSQCYETEFIELYSENQEQYLANPIGGIYSSNLEIFEGSTFSRLILPTEFDETDEFYLTYTYENACGVDSLTQDISILEPQEITSTNQSFCAGTAEPVLIEAFEPLGGIYVLNGDTIDALFPSLIDSTYVLDYIIDYNGNTCQTIHEVVVNFTLPDNIQTNLPTNICFNAEPIQIEHNLEYINFESDLLEDFIFDPADWHEGIHSLNYEANNGCGDTSSSVIIVVDSIVSPIILTDTICDNLNNVLNLYPEGGHLSANISGEYFEDIPNPLDGNYIPSWNLFNDAEFYYLYTNECGSYADTALVYIDNISTEYLDENYFICEDGILEFEYPTEEYHYIFQSDLIDSLGVFSADELAVGSYVIPYFVSHNCSDSMIFSIEIEEYIMPEIFVPDTICHDTELILNPVLIPEGGNLNGEGTSFGELNLVLANIETSGSKFIEYVMTNSCGFHRDTAFYELLELPPTSIVFGSSDYIEALENGTIYEWTLNGVLQEQLTEQGFIPSNEGLYSVRYFDGYCWSEWSEEQFISVNVSETYNEDKFEIYPNPSNGQFTIEVSPELIGEELRVYDGLGRQIHNTTLASSLTELRLDISKGVYSIHVKSSIIKVIIQ